MRRFDTLARLLFVVTVGAVGAAGAGCARQIGDECTTAADCNPNGTRSCDSSQPGGYCTIQGCDETSCPSESACLRYFPAQFLTTSCDPSAVPTGCKADEFCLDAGVCAPASQELRYCVKTCTTADDCRSGYECRLAGTRGSMALVSNPDAIIHFCAPKTTQ
jgi:hypothetical protein